MHLLTLLIKVCTLSLNIPVLWLCVSFNSIPTLYYYYRGMFWWHFWPQGGDKVLTTPPVFCSATRSLTAYRCERRGNGNEMIDRSFNQQERHLSRLGGGARGENLHSNWRQLWSGAHNNNEWKATRRSQESLAATKSNCRHFVARWRVMDCQGKLESTFRGRKQLYFYIYFWK